MLGDFQFINKSAVTAALQLVGQKTVFFIIGAEIMAAQKFQAIGSELYIIVGGSLLHQAVR